ncbi:MAG: serine/threonine-protein phosphatase [Candidatus Margulisbacteria bacterium]|jgi:serine/threonine protein phosphatase PrpC|nr:serine/threonine-protein phosphatase [Candidatus Margulisiibacteriota bacterium]
MNINKLKFATGFYKPRIEGPIRLGVVRNWFGLGKIVPGMVWGGGVSPAVEQRWLGTIQDVQAPLELKTRVLTDIASGKKTFNFVPAEQVRSVLTSLTGDQLLGLAATDALKALPPVPASKPAGKPFYEVVNISGGQDDGFASRQVGNITVAGFSHTTASRKNNEDGALVICDESNGRKTVMVILADGMGGYEHGEKASAATLQAFADRYLTYSKTPGANFSFDDALRDAARVVAAEQAGGTMSKEAGTTLACLLIDDQAGTAEIRHIGDSRVYLLRDEKLRVLTHDHNFLADLLRRWMVEPSLAPDISGLLDEAIKEFGPDPAAAIEQLAPSLSPARSRLLYRLGTAYYQSSYMIPFPGGMMRQFGPNISKAIGRNTDPALDAPRLKIKLEPGDRFIVASDGLHDFVEFDLLEATAVANQHRAPEEMSAALEAAVANPGDNITIVSCHYGQKAEAVTAKQTQPTQPPQLPPPLPPKLPPPLPPARPALPPPLPPKPAAKTVPTVDEALVAHRERLQSLEKAAQEQASAAQQEHKRADTELKALQQVEALRRLEIEAKSQEIAAAETALAQLKAAGETAKTELDQLVNQIAAKQGEVTAAATALAAKAGQLAAARQLLADAPRIQAEAEALIARIAALAGQVGTPLAASQPEVEGPTTKLNRPETAKPAQAEDEDGPTRPTIPPPPAADPPTSKIEGETKKYSDGDTTAGPVQTGAEPYFLNEARHRLISAEPAVKEKGREFLATWLNANLLLVNQGAAGLTALKEQLRALGRIDQKTLGIVVEMLSKRQPGDPPETREPARLVLGSIKRKLLGGWQIS